MPSLRKSIQKINQLDSDLPIDEDEQEELLELLKTDNIQTNKVFINIFTIIYLIPIPLFIHLKYFRTSSTISFLSIVSLVLSLIKIRYLHVINFANFESSIVQRLSILYKPLVFNVLNLIISSIVLMIRYEQGVVDLNLLYFIPFLASVSSILLMYWILELDNDITSLSKLKYKYKSA